MRNLEEIYFFVFVFTTLAFLKNVFKFIGALLQDNPQPVLFSDRELFLFALSISYILTYIKFL
jgi:hypothetical protein